MKCRSVFSVLMLSSLTCCNFAPKYEAPDLPLPTTWRTDTEEKEDLAIGNWWENLGDEVLNDLIVTALKNNKDLQVAIWRVSQYLSQYTVARSGLYPQASVGGAAYKERLPVNENFLQSLGISSITPEYQLNLSLAYELDFWGSIRNTAAAAHAQYLAQIENRRTVVLTLIGSVAEAYVYLRQLDLQLEISKNILTTRAESLQIARYRFEGGVTSEIEVEQAISVYEEAIASVRELERQIPMQENLLSVLLGRGPGPIARGKSLSDLILPSKVPSGMPSDLLTRRPDILRAENNLLAANANIGVARAAFFPQVNLATICGVSSLHIKTLFDNSSKTWSTGGSFLENIFTGGSLTGQLQIARAQKQEMVFSYEQTILTALAEVDDSLISLQKSKEIFAADKADVEALQRYLVLAWYQYYEGQTQYLTVLDAERSVFTAKINAVTAEADQFFYLINLYKALGGGWVVEADDHLLAEGQ